MLPLWLFAQKRGEQIVDAQDIQSIHINSDLIFKIKISAQPTDKIILNTIIDGETSTSTLVHVNIADTRLEITTGRLPDYSPFNDKLSAHKVLSIELDLIIPQNLSVNIRSTLAEVTLAGHYKDVAIGLGRGGFIGEDLRFRESVITTISGNISLLLSKATVVASSRNGTAQIDFSLKAGPSCILQSIYGDIEALQVD